MPINEIVAWTMFAGSAIGVSAVLAIAVKRHLERKTV